MKTFNFLSRQSAVLFALLFATTSFLVLSFGSCSPNETNQASTVGNNNDDSNTYRSGDSSDDGEDEPEDCDENEGDPCKDDDYCELTCERIYSRQTAVTSCKERGDETVGDLEIVHDRLMGKDAGYAKFKDRSKTKVASDLEKITDDDDDIGHDELKCYLQIGVNKYMSQIGKGLTRDSLSGAPDTTAKQSARDRLKETLKWMVKDKEVSKILNEINRGPAILKSLIEKLAELNDGFTAQTHDGFYKWQCLGEASYKLFRPEQTNANIAIDAGHIATLINNLPLRNTNINHKKNDQDLDQALWWLDSDNLKVWHYDPTTSPKGQEGTIQLTDADLFNALSCFHEIDGEYNNIFSYSAEENKNEHIFEIAFNLLKTSCEKAKDQKKPGCARALICWTSWQKKCDAREAHDWSWCHQSEDHNIDRNNTESLWDMIADNYKSDLEHGDRTGYNNCTTKGFYDFFK